MASVAEQKWAGHQGLVRLVCQPLAELSARDRLCLVALETRKYHTAERLYSIFDGGIARTRGLQAQVVPQELKYRHCSMVGDKRTRTVRAFKSVNRVQEKSM